MDNDELVYLQNKNKAFMVVNKLSTFNKLSIT